MPPKTKTKAQAQARRATLLSMVPVGATRIQVRNAKGKIRYRELGKLTESDVIQTNKKGCPIVMQAPPGRAPTPKLEPATPEVAALLTKKREALEDDGILSQAKEDPDSPDVLYGVLLGLGEEAASIKFEREEAERTGKETSTLSGRRITALKAVGDTWLKRREQIIVRGLDLDSPAFKVVMTFMLETVRESMQTSGLRPEVIDAVFAKLSNMLNAEWEIEARNRVKSIV